MRVTLLIPVYKAERYIAECCQSLFGQTYAHIDYVFYDDCTPDASIDRVKAVLAHYPHRQDHVRIIRGDHNRGTGHVRQQLVEAVRTEAFAFADSDDRMPPEAIEHLVGRMQETGTDIVDGAICYWTKGQLQPPILPSHDDQRRYRRKAMCQNLVAHHLWGRLFRTDILPRVPALFGEGIDLAEDYCAMTRLAAVATRSWIDTPVYHYRVDEQSWFNTQATERKMQSYLKAYAKVLAFYRQRGPLPLALEVGIMNMYRVCRQNGYPPSAPFDAIVGYRPEHTLARMLYAMFHSTAIPYTLTDKAYRLVRAIAII